MNNLTQLLRQRNAWRSSSLFATMAEHNALNGLAAGLYPCDNVTSTPPWASTKGGGEWTSGDGPTPWTAKSMSKIETTTSKPSPTPPAPSTSATSTPTRCPGDVKVYGNYAFIVSEAGGHGAVFDLTKLRNVNNPP